MKEITSQCCPNMVHYQRTELKLHCQVRMSSTGLLARVKLNMKPTLSGEDPLP